MINFLIMRQHGLMVLTNRSDQYLYYCFFGFNAKNVLRCEN